MLTLIASNADNFNGMDVLDQRVTNLVDSGHTHHEVRPVCIAMARVFSFFFLF